MSIFQPEVIIRQTSNAKMPGRLFREKKVDFMNILSDNIKMGNPL